MVRRTRGWRDPAKERFWRKAVRGWRRSGLSVRAYCAGNQLSEQNFYAWRREIARRDQEKFRGGASDHHRESRPRRAQPVSPENLFMPVQVMSEQSYGRIEIVLSSSRVVRVEPGFDRFTLREVVMTLEGLSC